MHEKRVRGAYTRRSCKEHRTTVHPQKTSAFAIPAQVSYYDFFHPPLPPSLTQCLSDHTDTTTTAAAGAVASLAGRCSLPSAAAVEREAGKQCIAKREEKRESANK